MSGDRVPILSLSKRVGLFFQLHFGWQLLRPVEMMSDGFASFVFSATVRRPRSTGHEDVDLVVKGYEASEEGLANLVVERKALAALPLLGHSVPQLIWAEPSAEQLGFPFLIMSRVAGKSVWMAYEDASGSGKNIVVQRFTEGLVDLHRTPPQVLGDAHIGSTSSTYIDLEIAVLREAVDNLPQLELGPIVAWLEDHKSQVGSRAPVILHRDYHPWNALWDECDQVWIFDWNWGLGDARFDVAWTCALMERSDYYEFSRLFQREYMRQAGDELCHLEFFTIMVTARWLLNVTLAQHRLSEIPGNDTSEFLRFLTGPTAKARDLLAMTTRARFARGGVREWRDGRQF